MGFVPSFFFFSGRAAEVSSEIASVNLMIVCVLNKQSRYLIMLCDIVGETLMCVSMDSANDFPHNAV